ncbi:unnamed protein product [Rotaria sp. Silwood2]|nr:unnamed protein product [Rotaria sp. Silwood2]CAF4326117.1 unnamed protein product [Rotaria sp. Silwood2]CAF4555314.1 unnamed protein product [Rotaria sp. Silwood2]
MSNKAMQMIKKRSIKPKTQYSPSNSTGTTTMHHLIMYNDSGNIMIVGNSSVKRLQNDGTVILNDGHTAKLIISGKTIFILFKEIPDSSPIKHSYNLGTKDKCMEQWNKRSLSINNNDDYEQDEDEDVIPKLMEQTLQMPTKMFSTRTFLVSSSKRFARENHSNHASKRLTNVSFSPQSSNRIILEASSVTSSSDEEEGMINTSDKVSLNRIFQELKNTQTNLQGARNENRDMHKQLTTLTQKINHFNSLKNDHDLDRYRDSNDTEDFRKEVMHEGRNLLDVPARNAGEYARNLLKILFKPHELQTSLLPSLHSTKFSKSQLDQERIDRLNEAVRAQYRITKHHYTSFYKERIQVTLACCVYNEGVRKQKKQMMQQQQQIVQQTASQVEQQSITTASFD